MIEVNDEMTFLFVFITVLKYRTYREFLYKINVTIQWTFISPEAHSQLQCADPFILVHIPCTKFPHLWRGKNKQRTPPDFSLTWNSFSVNKKTKDTLWKWPLNSSATPQEEHNSLTSHYILLEQNMYFPCFGWKSSLLLYLVGTLRYMYMYLSDEYSPLSYGYFLYWPPALPSLRKALPCRLGSQQWNGPSISLWINESMNLLFKPPVPFVKCQIPAHEASQPVLSVLLDDPDQWEKQTPA